MRGVWPIPASAVCCALLALAAPAHAGTQIGMVADSNPDNCSNHSEFMQGTVGTGGPTPSYDVPSGGVITSWSTKPGPDPGTGARLKVYRPTADDHTWTVVGESAAKILTPDTVNTSSTRIPVQAGDRIAIRTASGNGGPCDFPYTVDLGPGYSVLDFGSLSGLDPTAGSPVDFIDSSPNLVNIAAVVEPDADGDGFGDETQDQCLSVAGTVNGCPAAVAVPPPPEPQVPLVPKFNLAVKPTQHVLEQHGVVISVQPNVAGTVTATATVSLPAAGKVLRFRRATRNVAAGAKAVLKLRLTRAELSRIKVALRRHRKLVAKVVVTTTASGNEPSASRRKIRLQR
jgi:hypothetical protein